MNEIDWKQVRINYAGLAMQGMLERDQTVFSKVLDDFCYERLADHCVSIADALVKKLKERESEVDEIL